MKSCETGDVLTACPFADPLGILCESLRTVNHHRILLTRLFANIIEWLARNELMKQRNTNNWLARCFFSACLFISINGSIILTGCASSSLAPTLIPPTLTVENTPVTTPTAIETPAINPSAAPAAMIPSATMPLPASPTLTRVALAFTPTARPTIAALNVPTARTAPPGVSSDIKVSEGSVTFAAYPFEKFLQPRSDPARNFTFDALDRDAYDRAATGATLTKTFRSVILENEFLRLTFLPELGGRLFQITYKPTNQNLFYNNRVLKPTHWGPANQGGWLAVGGMEWTLPVNEHGYEWGTPWQYAVTQNASGATITLSDSQLINRVRAQIQVTLPAHAAYVVVHPRVENPTASATRLQFWINAQLTLGASKNVSPNTEFILPTQSVFIHSSGDQFIPEANVPADEATAAAAPLSWPTIGGHNLARYSNWEDYLGVFATNLTQSFVGAYNHDAELGIARIFAPQQTPGAKLFAFGPKFCCRSEFSDDGSDYFELWGGLPRTFFANDDVTIPAGASREWSESWIPFAGTGGLSAAARDAVLHLSSANGSAQVSAYSAVARGGTLMLLQAGREVKRWSVSLSPAAPFRASIPIADGPVQLQLLDTDQNVIVRTE